MPSVTRQASGTGEVESDQELVVRRRGTGAAPGIIEFESQSSVYPQAPWKLMVANGNPDEHDHVFHQLYNCTWDDVDKTWVRDTANEHAIRWGFEARYHGSDPSANRGFFEWNLDLNPELTGGLSFPLRTWFYSYDMDGSISLLQFGSTFDTARNRIEVRGSLHDITSLAMKTPGAVRTVTDGVVTLGSRTVTSATAAFTSADEGGPISGTGIPAGAFIKTINSATSITYDTAHVVATASNSGVTLTITRTSDQSGTSILQISDGAGETLFDTGSRTFVINRFGTGGVKFGEGGGDVNFNGNVKFNSTFAWWGATPPQWAASGLSQQTVGAAGGASAPPATPAEWIKIRGPSGTTRVIPAYPVS